MFIAFSIFSGCASVDRYLERADEYYGKKNYNKAISAYSQALSIDPELDKDLYSSNLASAYYQRGSTYYQNKDYSSAISDYTQAIKYEPEAHAYYYFSRHEAYSAIGDIKNALADYNTLLNILPFHMPISRYALWKGLVLDYEKKYNSGAPLNQQGTIMLEGDIVLLAQKNKFLKDYVDSGKVTIRGGVDGARRDILCYPPGEQTFIVNWNDGRRSTGEVEIKRDIQSGHIYKICAEINGDTVSFKFDDVTEAELPVTVKLEIPEPGEEINSGLYHCVSRESDNNGHLYWFPENLGRILINYAEQDFGIMVIATDINGYVQTIECAKTITDLTERLLFAGYTVKYFVEEKGYSVMKTGYKTNISGGDTSVQMYMLPDGSKSVILGNGSITHWLGIDPDFREERHE
jgi:tetratricopeptide (TPR) repeat protein